MSLRTLLRAFSAPDALFCSVADGIASGTGMSLEGLEAAHEEIWTLFEGGYFKLAGTDDNVGIVPCHSHDERRAVAEQNKPLADYRRHVIEEARSQAAGKPREAQRGELVCLVPCRK
jgi:hypothetical protein